MKLRNTLLITIFLLLCSCSRDKEKLQVADKFFEAYDSKDFKLAYGYLSEDDKRAMSSDSFYVLFYTRETRAEEKARLGEFSKISTYIENQNEDTVIVRQVWRIPDHDLIYKTMREISKEDKFLFFLQKMQLEKSVPMILDSSRTLKLIEENGKFVVYASLAKYVQNKKCLSEKETQYLNKLIIEPQKIKLTKIDYKNYIATLYIDIINTSDVAISGFKCSISIDGKNVIDDAGILCFMEDGTLNVEPGQKASVFEYLRDKKNILQHYIPSGSRIPIIEGNRIKIQPKMIISIDFAVKITSECRAQSGFNEFSFVRKLIDWGWLFLNEKEDR